MRVGRDKRQTMSNGAVRNTSAPHCPVHPVFWIAGLIALCAILPVILVRFLPSNDYPFHMARIVILSQLDNPIFDRFYDLGSFLLPNLAMDAVALLLAQVIPPELAARAFVALTLLVMLIGPILLHRAAHGRFSPWPLLAIAFLHNGIFAFGFFNYLFGAGLAFIAAAIWMVLKPDALRLVVGFLCAIVLMYCHMEAFGIFAVIAGSLEIYGAMSRWRSARVWRILADLCCAAAPFILAIALFSFLSPTADVSGQGFGYSSWLGAKPWSFLFSLSSGILWLDVFTAVVLIGLGGWLVFTARLTISKPLAFAAIMLSAAFMILPGSLMGSHFVDSRLGPALAMLFLVTFDLRENSDHRAGRAVIFAACALTLVRTAAFISVWSGDEKEITPVIQALSAIEPGATLFAATAEPYPSLFTDTAERRAAWRPPLKHIASYAVLRGPVFVPMTFADPAKQPLIVSPDYAGIKAFQDDNPVKLPDRNALDTLLAQITGHLRAGDWPDIGAPYLLVAGSDRLHPLTLPPGVTRINGGDRFVLLRIANVRAQ